MNVAKRSLKTGREDFDFLGAETILLDGRPLVIMTGTYSTKGAEQEWGSFLHEGQEYTDGCESSSSLMDNEKNGDY